MLIIGTNGKGVLMCEPGQYGQALQNPDPCACDVDGIVNGVDTGRAGCDQHLGSGWTCYVDESCGEEGVMTTTQFGPSVKFRYCNAAADNVEDSYECVACPSGTVSNAETAASARVSCTPCASGSYSEPEGSTECTTCPALHISSEGSAGCVEALHCEPGSGGVQNFTDPCACDWDGIVHGIDTGMPGCKDHGTIDGIFCYMRMECEGFAQSGTFPGTRVNGDCDEILDNVPASCELCPKDSFSSTMSIEACTPCGEGGTTDGPGATSANSCSCPAGAFFDSSSESSPCTTCPLDTFSSEPGASTCESCPDGLRASPGSASLDDCMNLKCYSLTMKDSYGDGWTGNELNFMRPDSGLVVQGGLALEGAEATIDVCFGCGCFVGAVDGTGAFLEDVSWTLVNETGYNIATASETSAAS
ncbi:hypothetical protein TeGR_g2062, partial [Tetraparma gracilis]